MLELMARANAPLFRDILLQSNLRLCAVFDTDKPSAKSLAHFIGFLNGCSVRSGWDELELRAGNAFRQHASVTRQCNGIMLGTHHEGWDSFEFSETLQRIM